jgi:hypothetical protein
MTLTPGMQDWDRTNQQPEPEMPTISMFYGILVSMYVLDTDRHHSPHIHIRYNEHKAVVRDFLMVKSWMGGCPPNR